MNYTTLFSRRLYWMLLVISWFVITGVAFYLDHVRSKKIQKGQKVQMEINMPDTVFIYKINDTIFQKRNITYIIR